MSKQSEIEQEQYSKNVVLHNAINDVMNHLTGEILTIIDAVVTNELQNKAVKDLVKDKFYPARTSISKIVYGPENSLLPLGERELPSKVYSSK